ncbi:integrin alpha-V-like [Manacus candei]|uniref:integrin alpha-V-like n=1 Tax=Manacus candei TaxID=415023 RepID=UPI002226D72B|nr:integrin alpha-V-like [Manacus candei]
MTITKGGKMNCKELDAFLRDESEFRDKLTPIAIFMEYRLDYRTAADATGLHPILNQFTPANMSRQVYIAHTAYGDRTQPSKLIFILRLLKILRYLNIHLGFGLWITKILMVIVNLVCSL